jgi:hypothetical protein
MNYGDDAEYDAWIEKQADPDWAGTETDPSGWMADREQARWERQMNDRGAATGASLIAVALAALAAISLVHDPGQRVLLATCLAIAVICFGWLWHASRPIEERIDAEVQK